MSGRSRGIVRGTIMALLLVATGVCRAADAPPSATPAPAAHAVKLVNADFEAKPAAGGGIEGWETASHATANAYTFDLDDKVKHAGKASLRIRRSGKEPWGMVHQTLPAAGLAGRTLEFSAWLRPTRNGVSCVSSGTNGAVPKPIIAKPRKPTQSVGAQPSSAAEPFAPDWTVCSSSSSPVVAETAAIVCERLCASAPSTIIDPVPFHLD